MRIVIWNLFGIENATVNVIVIMILTGIMIMTEIEIGTGIEIMIVIETGIVTVAVIVMGHMWMIEVVEAKRVEQRKKNAINNITKNRIKMI